MNRLAVSLAAWAVACVVALPVCAQSVELTGPDGAQATVTGEAWAGLARQTLDLTIHGQTHSYSGPLLATVLGALKAPTGEALRGAALTSYVVVRAADGYGVVLSLAEVDPAMRQTRVILADRMDGEPIPAADGPLRLIVEGDARPARSARQVTAIDLKRAD